jgi:aspartate-semialdehyde dehydrogenase
MKVAIVWATGLVGREMEKVLIERNFPVTQFVPVASERSIGNSIMMWGNIETVIWYKDAIAQKVNLAIFSAGWDTSKLLAPEFAQADITVIDNSSAWRMDPTKKLIVPEVNAHVLEKTDKIIANPNCSTIQMVVALKPLHDRYKIKRVVVSTYQAVSGSGKKWTDQLQSEIDGGRSGLGPYIKPINKNVIPHIDTFLPNGYTKEEMKMVNETKKIMGDESIRVTATTVRVPVMVGHSESVNIEFHQDFDLEEVYSILEKSPWIIVVDAPDRNEYVTPRDVEGCDEVFISRIRRDESQKNTLNMWIVADNLRKWAATNAVQIAEYLNQKGWL